jgi:predicted deacetylase
MATRRKSIGLLAHERQLLIELYLKWRIPISQFKKRPEDQRLFVAEWNKRSQRLDDEVEVIHYMRTQRKRGLWVTLDGDHLAGPPMMEFSAEDTEVLVVIFRENISLLGAGSDVLSHESELMDLVAKEFAANTGRIVPNHELLTKITALRKRGLLPKAEHIDADDVAGFEDIDDVAL